MLLELNSYDIKWKNVRSYCLLETIEKCPSKLYSNLPFGRLVERNLSKLENLNCVVIAQFLGRWICYGLHHTSWNLIFPNVQRHKTHLKMQVQGKIRTFPIN